MKIEKEYAEILRDAHRLLIERGIIHSSSDFSQRLLKIANRMDQNIILSEINDRVKELEESHGIKVTIKLG